MKFNSAVDLRASFFSFSSFLVNVLLYFCSLNHPLFVSKGDVISEELQKYQKKKKERKEKAEMQPNQRSRPLLAVNLLNPQSIITIISR